MSISSPSIRMAGLGVTTALSAHQLQSARFHLHRSSVCVICDLEEGHGILAATRPLLSSESADCGALCLRTADFSLTVTPANCIIASTDRNTAKLNTSTPVKIIFKQIYSQVF